MAEFNPESSPRRESVAHDVASTSTDQLWLCQYTLRPPRTPGTPTDRSRNCARNRRPARTANILPALSDTPDPFPRDFVHAIPPPDTAWETDGIPTAPGPPPLTRDQATQAESTLNTGTLQGPTPILLLYSPAQLAAVHFSSNSFTVHFK